MDCKRCKVLLLEFTEGSLSPSEEAKVHDHIEICEDCQQHLARLRNTFSILDTETPPTLSKVQKQAMFPLVMERIERRTIMVRRRRRWIYSLSSAAAVIAIFVVSFIGIRSQGQTDYYTVFVNPDRILYSDDTEVNDYLIKSLIGDDTLISEMKNAVDDEWISNSELTSLVEDLSDDELDVLIERLETLELNGG